MQLIFGPIAENWQVTLFPNYEGFLLAILPPGAFLVLGLLIALKNQIDSYYAARQPATIVPVASAADRRIRPQI